MYVQLSKFLVPKFPPQKTLMKLTAGEVIIFKSVLTTFEANVIFCGSWGSCENWLKPNIKSLHFEADWVV